MITLNVVLAPQDTGLRSAPCLEALRCLVTRTKKKQGLSDDACFSEERRMWRAEWKDKIRNRTRGVL